MKIEGVRKVEEKKLQGEVEKEYFDCFRGARQNTADSALPQTTDPDI